MKKIVVVYASRYGHTKLLAEHVASGAADVADTEVVIHTAEEAEKALAELDAADAIIFGTATYMGSAASEMKHFMEEAAGRWFSRAWAERGKILLNTCESPIWTTLRFAAHAKAGIKTPNKTAISHLRKNTENI